MWLIYPHAWAGAKRLLEIALKARSSAPRGTGTLAIITWTNPPITYGLAAMQAESVPRL